MRLTKFLKPELIELDLKSRMPAEIDPDANLERIRREHKESVVRELAQLLCRSRDVANEKKLFIDLWNREKKATTGVGDGIALPHVRTMQARQFIMAIARSSSGIDFDAVDGKPVHLFIAMVSPPYDDHLYLKIYRQIGRMFARGTLKERILSAESADEVIALMGSVD